jgi:signal transduction histidine kinase/CheY-like chemotaxis protein
VALAERFFEPDASWTRALEKYGAATRLTVDLYGHDERLLLGPVHTTPLFELLASGHHVASMFTACVQRCLTQPAGASTIVVEQRQGFALIGSSLTLNGEVAAAAVAGYALTSFPDEHAVRWLAKECSVPFATLWQRIRAELPLTRARLKVYGELLQVLGNTLLSENFRARQHEQAAKRLAAADQAKDDFLAVLSHELRNPLGAIQIAAQTIRLGQASQPAVQRATEVVDRQVKHVARLLDDLLDVSRITRGRIELRKSPVYLATVVAGALDTSRALIEARGHALTISLPEEPVRLEADPTRLEQIVTNLLDNAAKYTPPQGHIAVTATREEHDLVLRVRDTGIGISSAMLPHVFDLFTQGDRSLAHSQGGLGIGLTLVRKLVDLHGGTVTVHSEGLGRGSEVAIRLPLGTPFQAPSEPAIARRGPSRHILVIEDNPDAREMLRILLEVDGHRVEVAEDGRQGVKMARSSRPEVALVDIGLPGLDGYEVARQMRALLGRQVRLVALTGYGQPEDRRRAAEAGFDAHLIKPVSAEQIEEILEGGQAT